MEEIPSPVHLRLLRMMLTIRKFEECALDLYSRGFIPGMIHLYIGEEAVAAGVCARLREDDYITGTHRGHGHAVAKGSGLGPMIAELCGKYAGCCKGKGGSMHVADMDKGILGANGIAGGGLPIATGAAWAAKWQKNGRIAACFFGDDASNNGTFHESLNLAAIHKLPVIYVCENNLYGISVPQQRHQAVADIALRAQGYGMPGEIVDGNDVAAVYEAAERAARRAREGLGPTLLECKTYRLRGHHEGDPGFGERYRSLEEIEEWRKRDPILLQQSRLTASGLLTSDELAAMTAEIDEALAEAVRFAHDAPSPPPEELLTDVFA